MCLPVMANKSPLVAAETVKKTFSISGFSDFLSLGLLLETSIKNKQLIREVKHNLKEIAKTFTEPGIVKQPGRFDWKRTQDSAIR